MSTCSLSTLPLVASLSKLFAMKADLFLTCFALLQLARGKFIPGGHIFIHRKRFLFGQPAMIILDVQWRLSPSQKKVAPQVGSHLPAGRAFPVDIT